MTTLTISLPESLKKYVARQVKTKGYGNTSEYFRGLLRDAQSHEAGERLEALLIEGLEGEDIEVNGQFWTDLKAQARRIARRRRTHKQ